MNVVLKSIIKGATWKEGLLKELGRTVQGDSQTTMVEATAEFSLLISGIFYNPKKWRQHLSTISQKSLTTYKIVGDIVVFRNILVLVTFNFLVHFSFGKTLVFVTILF